MMDFLLGEEGATPSIDLVEEDDAIRIGDTWVDVNGS